jgi:UDP-glucose 4-epimerase
MQIRCYKISPIEEEMMPRCVVLGANGFIGSHVSAALLRAGHEVIACDITRDFSTIPRMPTQQLETVTLDFLDSATVRNVVQGADWVFHLVATTLPATSNANMAFDIESNIAASVHLLEACADTGVSKLVFASSGGTVYGSPTILPVPEEAATDPIVSYGITKLTIEKYCNLFSRLRGLKTVCLRLANAYGPRHVGTIQGAIPVFLKCILAGKPIVIWGDGSVVRDYVYVEDVAHAFQLAAEYAGERRVINIGSGTGVSLRQLLAEIQDVVQRPCRVEFERGRPFDISQIYLDITRARNELNWAPRVTLREGLRLTWNAMIECGQGAAAAAK